MQHLVVPTFVLNPRGEVVVWNRACERLTGVPADDVIGSSKHWRAFYRTKRFCLADLVALERPDLLSTLYPEFTVSAHGLGFSAENWCVMPNLGNQLYLAIDAGPIHDEDGKLIAVVETLRDMTDQKRAVSALKALASSERTDRPRQSALFRSGSGNRMGACAAHEIAALAAARRRRSFQVLQRPPRPPEGR
jgi:hypothetical protein